MVKFLGTHKGKTIMNSLFSIGAGIVIIGALGKINHTSWGGPALTIGMTTECILFFIMILVPVEDHYYWERYYPEILVDPTKEIKENGGKLGTQEVTFAIGSGGGSSSNLALDKLDDMLVKADITPLNLKKLSDNFTKLNKTLESMSEVGAVVSNTADFAVETKNATEVLKSLKGAYANVVSGLANDQMAESVRNFQGQMQTLSKNLASLNVLMSSDQKGEGFGGLKDYFQSVNVVVGEMQNTMSDVKKTQEQITILAANLSNLNEVYGRMISAVRG